MVGASSAGFMSGVGRPFSRPAQIDICVSPAKIRLRNTSRCEGFE